MNEAAIEEIETFAEVNRPVIKMLDFRVLMAFERCCTHESF